MWQEYVEIIAADLKRWSESPVEWVIRVSAAVFAVFFVIIFVFDSSMAFGLSLGLTGFLSRVMMLGLAVVLSALCWSLLFLFGNHRKLSVSLTYVFLVAVSAVFFDMAIVDEADAQWSVGESIVAAKTEYFCFKRFNARQCVRHVNLCPQCTKQMDRWKRMQVADRLKNVSRNLSSVAK